MAYQPWLISSLELRDLLYEIPKDVVINFWNKCRPELHMWTKSDERQNINEKGWRLGKTGYIQCLRLSLVDGDETGLSVLTFTGKCHAEMEQQWYNISLAMSVINKTAEVIERSECSCPASKQLKNLATCKHIIALFYALEHVIDGGDIPEWNHPCTNFGQQWHVPGRARMGAELKPERADIYAHFLRPDKRSAWKPDVRSRIAPQHRGYSKERLQAARDFICENPNLFPETLLRVVEDPHQ